MPGRELLRGLDAAFRPGTMVAVLGRNGAGKSSLLHVLAGLAAPAAGEVQLGQRSLADWPRRELARRLGLLTQASEDPFPGTALETALVGRHPHLDFWQWESETDRAVARDCLAAMSVLTVLAQKSGGAMGLMESVALPARLLVAAESLVIYLLHILFPVNLLFFYPYPKHISFLSGEYFISVLSVAGITAVCLFLARKSRLWLSVWAYYVVTLLPVLGIVQIGMQARADRYMYLPGIGPLLLLGLALAWVFTRTAASVKKQVITAGLVAASGLLLVLLSTITIRQISVWKDSITLWSSIIAKEPERAFFAFHNRGIAFSRLGEYDKAIEDYRMAIALRPDYADTYSNLGIALLMKGFPEEAIRNYRFAIALNPGLINAHRNLAVALYMSGRLPEALEHYIIIAGLRPGDAGAQNDLGSIYGAMGAYDKAIEHFQIALRLQPELADAHYDIAMAFRAVGRTQEAQEHFDAALRLSPQVKRLPNAPETR